MNFNFSHSNEYNLHTNLTDEFIKLYGIQSKLILTKKENPDSVVFGDWSSIKTDGKNIFDVHLYSENTAEFDGSYDFTEFGFASSDSTTVYISSVEAYEYGLTIEKMLSSLIVLPSNKVLEVTDVEHQVPNINNLWAYSDAKTAFKLTLRTYEFKLHDNIEQTDLVNTLEVDSEESNIEEDVQETLDAYQSLDNYFDTLLRNETKLTKEAEVKNTVPTSVENSTNNERQYKPVVNNDETDPFGWS